MFEPLDIFETDSDGRVPWRGAAKDFAAAKRHIERLALSAPAEYLPVNQKTGQRQCIAAASPDDLAQANSLNGDVQYIRWV